MLFNGSSFPLVTAEFAQEARCNDIKDMQGLQQREIPEFTLFAIKPGYGYQENQFYQCFGKKYAE